ncbi:MAG: hypothetical protein LBU61_04750, partial [Coriobacteriales bacterium]|nr:hypothetical protein [Coriobacteriales bacterium]
MLIRNKQGKHQATAVTISGKYKTTAVFMALLLAIAMLPVIAFANPPGTAEISVGTPIDGLPAEGYAAGDELVVPIYLDANPGFATAALT